MLLNKSIHVCVQHHTEIFRRTRLLGTMTQDLMSANTHLHTHTLSHPWQRHGLCVRHNRFSSDRVKGEEPHVLQCVCDLCMEMVKNTKEKKGCPL